MTCHIYTPEEIFAEVDKLPETRGKQQFILATNRFRKDYGYTAPEQIYNVIGMLKVYFSEAFGDYATCSFAERAILEKMQETIRTFSFMLYK
jgi:hypothetical protein